MLTKSTVVTSTTSGPRTITALHILGATLLVSGCHKNDAAMSEIVALMPQMRVLSVDASSDKLEIQHNQDAITIRLFGPNRWEYLVVAIEPPVADTPTKMSVTCDVQSDDSEVFFRLGVDLLRPHEKSSYSPDTDGGQLANLWTAAARVQNHSQHALAVSMEPAAKKMRLFLGVKSSTGNATLRVSRLEIRAAE